MGTGITEGASIIHCLFQIIKKNYYNYFCRVIKVTKVTKVTREIKVQTYLRFWFTGKEIIVAASQYDATQCVAFASTLVETQRKAMLG
jgi:hypothetical protein